MWKDFERAFSNFDMVELEQGREILVQLTGADWLLEEDVQVPAAAVAGAIEDRVIEAAGMLEDVLDVVQVFDVVVLALCVDIKNRIASGLAGAATYVELRMGTGGSLEDLTVCKLPFLIG